MTAYYNEIDPYAAQWLRNLIDAGHIAPGDVDERSIVDVRADDLRGYSQAHFFAGIGGWSRALRLAGWPDDRPVWTGSCPCQPFSLAGKQAGYADERHLWPTWARLIEVGRPPVVFGEQVASASKWLRLVRSDLEALGYAVGAIPIEAASAGADHLRDRYWFVANAAGEGSFPGSHAGIHRQQEGAGPRDGEPQRRGGANLAHADDAGSQRRQLLPERARERFARPNGLADAGCERRQQIAASSHGNETPHEGWPSKHDHVSASDGKIHGRDVADAKCGRCQSIARQSGICREENGELAIHESRADGQDDAGFEWVIGADGKARRVKSGIRLLAHGVPARVGKLRAFGNAIDPRPAAEFIGAAMTVTSQDQGTPT